MLWTVIMLWMILGRTFRTTHHIISRGSVSCLHNDYPANIAQHYPSSISKTRELSPVYYSDAQFNRMELCSTREISTIFFPMNSRHRNELQMLRWLKLPKINAKFVTKHFSLRLPKIPRSLKNLQLFRPLAIGSFQFKNRNIKTLRSGITGCATPPAIPITSHLCTDSRDRNMNGLIPLLINTTIVNETNAVTAIANSPPSNTTISKSQSSKAVKKKSSTRPRSGLLLILLPAIAAQLSVLKIAMPFIAARLSQYMSPINVIMSFTLQHRYGRMFTNSFLWGSLFLGGIFMIIDTFALGAAWSPLTPTGESYALVTG